MGKKCLKIILIFLLMTMVWSHSSYADQKQRKKRSGEGWAYSNELEFQALPPYCKAKFYPQDSQLYKKWRKKIGQNFIHFHHYCRGLTLIRRGQSEFEPKKRKLILREAMGEIDYMLKNCSKKLDPRIRALFHQKKAEIFTLTGRPGEAAIEMRKSAILKK